MQVKWASLLAGLLCGSRVRNVNKAEDACYHGWSRVAVRVDAQRNSSNEFYNRRIYEGEVRGRRDQDDPRSMCLKKPAWKQVQSDGKTQPRARDSKRQLQEPGNTQSKTTDARDARASIILRQTHMRTERNKHLFLARIIMSTRVAASSCPRHSGSRPASH